MFLRLFRSRPSQSASLGFPSFPLNSGLIWLDNGRTRVEGQSGAGGLPGRGKRRFFRSASSQRPRSSPGHVTAWAAGRAALGASSGQRRGGQSRGTHGGHTIPASSGRASGNVTFPGRWALPRVRPRSPGWVHHRRQPGSGAVACPSSARTVGGGQCPRLLSNPVAWPGRWRTASASRSGGGDW